VRYAFIERHEKVHGVRRLCTVMNVHPSGYYAWKKQPFSDKVRDDQRLLGLLKQAWLPSELHTVEAYLRAMRCSITPRSPALGRIEAALGALSPQGRPAGAPIRAKKDG